MSNYQRLTNVPTTPGHHLSQCASNYC